MQTYTSPIGTVHTVPKTWNRPRRGASTQWGNESGAVATQKHDAHILDVVVPLLGLHYDSDNGHLVAACGCVTATRTYNVTPLDTELGPCVPPKFQSDRALTDGDNDAPYAPGLIIPVCPRHNGSGERRAVAAMLRLQAEHVARELAVQ